ncbi:MAG: hypothetical protein IKU17_08585 [Clostridia bacterium]|nr:hypothetical protein [Clostridia bacterium]
MRIYINAKDAKLFFPFPNFLLYSKLGARVAAAVMQTHVPKNDVPLDYETIRAMQNALKESVRIHGHITLVDVEDADGDKVKIVL